MSKLSVKTRGNSTPQGKSRVYFSCYPQDLDTYFETISDEILAIQNCAIYYESEWEVPAEEDNLAAQLSDMQLFVIPLTSKYLFEECRATSFEYGFAMEHHIPVIPIAVENGIAEHFSERMNRIGQGFGDIQFLDRTSTDKTEISYEEKLKNKLESILANDELSARVRAAFDAYIFLSYRKKDRKYAKELMRVIHQIPFCRDIAIWYDEFLVPGEGWNEAIAQAMQKSKMVALAVTPSLLEPGNFIIEHEYPDALESGKRIVPAELVSTDRDALTRIFEGLDSPVDGMNLDEMTKVLEQMAFKTNDEPEHNFLIGLAYLGGIDVERDPEKAVSLISDAAKAGLAEAIKKLVSMYDYGEGIKCDYEAAIFWQQKLIAAYESDTDTDKKQLRKAVSDLGYMWKSIGKPKQALEAYEKALKIAEEINAEKSDYDSMTDITNCYDNLGHLYQSEGNLERAEEYLLKSLKIDEQALALRTDNPSRYILSIDYDNLGDLAFAKFQYSKAKDYYVKALEIKENKLKEDPDSFRYRRGVASLCVSIGNVSRLEGKLKEGKEYLYKGAQLYERIYAESMEEGDRDGVNLCYKALAMILKTEGRLDEAEQYLIRNRDDLIETLKKNESFATYSVLAEVYRLLSETYSARGDYSTEKDYVQKMLDIYQMMEKKAENRESKFNLCVGYMMMGDAYFEEYNYQTASEFYFRAKDIIDALAEKTRAKEDLELQLDVYKSVASFYLSQNNLEQMEGMLNKALKISQILNYENSTDVECQQLCSIYRRYAELCKARREIFKAIEWYEKAVKITEKRISESESISNLRELSEFYKSIGSLYYAERKNKEAIECFKKAIEISEKKVAVSEETGSKNTLALSRIDLGHIYIRSADFDKGKEQLFKAVEIAEKMWDQDHNPNHREMLEKAYYSLAEAENLKKNYSAAEQYILKNIELLEMPGQDYYTFRLNLASGYKLLGVIYQNQKLLEKAGEAFEKSVSLAEKLEKNIDNYRVNSFEYLTDIYANYADYLCAAGNTETALTYIQKALDLSRSLVKKDSSFNSRMKLNNTIFSASYLYSGGEEYDKALDTAQESVKLTEALALENPVEEILINRTNSYVRVAAALLDIEKYEEAESFFLKAADYAEQNAEKINKSYTTRQLAEIYRNLGNLYKKTEQTKAARDYYERAAHEYLKVSDETKLQTDIHEYMSCCENAGIFCKKEEDSEAAKEWFVKERESALFLIEQFHEESSEAYAAYSCEQLGKFCNKEEKLEMAEEYFKQAIPFRKRIVQRNENDRTVRNLDNSLDLLATLYVKMAKNCQKSGDNEGTKKFYAEAIETREQMAGSAEDLDNQQEMGNCCSIYAVLLQEENNLEAALGFYKKGYAEFEKMAEKDSEIGYRFLLTVCERMRQTYEALENSEELEKIWQKLIETANAIAAKTSAPADIFNLAAIYYNYEDHCTDLEDFVTAMKCCEAEISYFKLLADTGDQKSCYQLGQAYFRMADYLENQEQPDLGEAERFYLLAKGEWLKLAEETKAEDFLNMAAGIDEKLKELKQL